MLSLMYSPLGKMLRLNIRCPMLCLCLDSRWNRSAVNSTYFVWPRVLYLAHLNEQAFTRVWLELFMFVTRPTHPVIWGDPCLRGYNLSSNLFNCILAT